MNIGPAELRSFLTRPIAFHRLLAVAGGSVGAGLFLSQLIYWSERTKDPEGWIYKTFDDWWEEAALSRYELETIRKALGGRGLISERRAGIPAKLYYRMNWDALMEAIPEAIRTHRDRISKSPLKEDSPQSAALQQSRMRRAHKQDVAADKSAETQRSIISDQRVQTESTTKKVVVASSVSEEERRIREFLDELSSRLGLSRKQRKEVEGYIPEPGETYLREKEALTFSEPRENVGRYFMAALRDDWKLPVSTKKAKTEKRSAPVQGELLPPQELTEEQRAANLAKLREAKQAAKDAGGNT